MRKKVHSHSYDTACRKSKYRWLFGLAYIIPRNISAIASKLSLNNITLYTYNANIHPRRCKLALCIYVPGDIHHTTSLEESSDCFMQIPSAIYNFRSSSVCARERRWAFFKTVLHYLKYLLCAVEDIIDMTVDLIFSTDCIICACISGLFNQKAFIKCSLLY